MPKKDVDKELDDLLGVEDGDDDGDADGDADVKALKEELAALKKENHGLLSTVKKERGKRQNSDGRLEQLTATVNDIIAQNKGGAADPTPAAEADDGLRVLYNEDGDPYLPTESLNTLLTQQQEEINQLKETLQITSSNQNAQLEAEKAKMAIVGKNDAFGPVYNKYQSARGWVEKQVDQWQRDTGNVGKQVMSGYALDNIFDEGLRDEFAKQFPDMDIADVVTAEDSFWHFEQMLSKGLPKEETTETKKPDSRFQQVLKKPSALGKTANANTEPTLSEKAGSLSAEDLINLTDKQIEALEKAMLSEERNEGINFK